MATEEEKKQTKESATFKDMLKQLEDQNTLTKAAKDATNHQAAINVALQNDSLALSSDQRNNLQAMVKSLDSDKLGKAEDAKEKNKIAEDTLKALNEIVDNTADLGKLDSNAEKAAAGILGLPTLILALGAGFVFGVAESFAKVIKFFGKGILKTAKLAIKTLFLPFKAVDILTGSNLAKKFKDISRSFKISIASLKAGFSGADVDIKAFRKSFGNFTKLNQRMEGIGKSVKATMTSMKNIGPNIAKSIGASIKGVGQSIKGSKFIKPVIDGVRSMFKFVTTPFNDVKNAVSSFKKMMPGGGGIGKMIKPVTDSIGKVMKVLRSITKGAFAFGRILGRVFLPISIIMGLFDFVGGAMDGFKKYSEKGFFEGLMGGLLGGVSALLVGIVGMPLDLLKDMVSWLLEKMGFGEASEFLDSFSFSEMIGSLFTSLTDTIMDGIGSIKDQFEQLSIMDFIGNMTLGLVKILKKIAMFPLAVAAGAIGALAGAFSISGSAAEGFMNAFNKVMEFGDSTIDGFKAEVKPDDSTQKGAEIKQISEDVELSKASGNNQQAALNVMDASNKTSNVSGDTVILSAPAPNRIGASLGGGI
jgi:hypothetical protein